MPDPNKLRGSQVNSITTKFYYKNDLLCFKIVLNYGKQESIFYKDFDDYDKYQQRHEMMIKAMNDDMEVTNDFIALA